MSIFKRFWKRYSQTGILVSIIVLAIFIGFRLGEVTANNNTAVNISVNNLKNANPNQERINTVREALRRQGVDLEVIENTNKKSEGIIGETKDCLFVASRKSHKYHTANCRYGKNIKLANKVCFKSQEEARSKGFMPAKGCIKNDDNFNKQK